MAKFNKLLVLGLTSFLSFGIISCGGNTSIENPDNNKESTTIESSNTPSEGSNKQSENIQESLSKVESTSESQISEENTQESLSEAESASESQISEENSQVSEELSASESEAIETPKQYTRIDYYGNEKDNGDYVLLGSYPQRHVRDEKVIAALDEIEERNSLGYIEYNGEQYSKVTAKVWNNSTSYIFSSTVSIVSGKDYYFKVSPIMWKIVTINDDGTALLFSEKLLDARAYQSEYETKEVDGKTYFYNSTFGVPDNIASNNYKYSEIRNWINGEFYYKAFTEEQREVIKKTMVDNSSESTCEEANQYTCEDTEDKVFLLSYKEVTTESYAYVTQEGYVDARYKSGSDYALARGLLVNYDKSCHWWLRSPDANSFGFKARCIRIVANTGHETRQYVTYSEYGVAPAINITL